MLNLSHFRDYVIIPTLKRMGGKFFSLDAVCLLLGTALHESRLEFLKQIGGGPALGVYQLEPATIKDLHNTFLNYRPELDAVVNSLMSAQDKEIQAITNLSYSTALARLKYFRVSEQIPQRDNPRAMARYWKAHYNTYLGAGKVEDFENSYREHILTL